MKTALPDTISRAAGGACAASEVQAARRAPALAIRAADLIVLTKARITLMVALATGCGYFLASGSPFDVAGLLHALAAVMLISAGACALNQFAERDVDALMERTRNRPLPAGRMLPAVAATIGTTLCVAGIAYMAVALNLLAAFLGAFTVASYIFVYTPLKRLTPLCTIVGAVPGAMPPVIGWAAGAGNAAAPAWVLFAVIFLWQLPHFLAIAWRYRDDYAQAGLPMLGVAEPDARRTARQIVVQALGLLVISLFPTMLGMAGPLYFAAALATGLAYAGLGVWWVLRPERDLAFPIFVASIVHLPALFILMMLDKAVA